MAAERGDDGLWWADWDPRWSAKDYEWPTLESPTKPEIDAIRKTVVGLGGRANEEAHADRGFMMEQPNGNKGTKIRKQQARCECRRRALVTLVNVAEEPLKVCVICDSAHRWPVLA